jgi:hypothetical protein
MERQSILYGPLGSEMIEFLAKDEEEKEKGIDNR